MAAGGVDGWAVAAVDGPEAWAVTVTVDGTAVTVTVFAAVPEGGVHPTRASDARASDAIFFI